MKLQHKLISVSDKGKQLQTYKLLRCHQGSNAGFFTIVLITKQSNKEVGEGLNKQTEGFKKIIRYGAD